MWGLTHRPHKAASKLAQDYYLADEAAKGGRPGSLIKAARAIHNRVLAPPDDGHARPRWPRPWMDEPLRVGIAGFTSAYACDVCQDLCVDPGVWI